MARNTNDLKLSDTPEPRGICMVGAPPARTRSLSAPEAWSLVCLFRRMGAA